ncbi:hypothetical protein, partial [Klebsiella pneumoniae]|uniref:hypothetical protein n=1 Tax=Klebsiella pneumoniae TaxID=573 RepID=UPI00196731E4
MLIKGGPVNPTIQPIVNPFLTGELAHFPTNNAASLSIKLPNTFHSITKRMNNGVSMHILARHQIA